MIQASSSHPYDGMLLGWRAPRHQRQLGFHPPSSAPRRPPPVDDGLPDASPAWLEAPVLYEGDSHLMTFAPTGSGKGRGMVIPTLLTYDGSCVVVDPKGENYAVTARRRREMGQQVVVLDPFGRATRGRTESDCFNPLDIFNLPGTIIDADSLMVAWQIAAGNAFARDPFWDNSGTGLLFGLIAHVVTGLPPAERTLNRVLEYLYADDVIYNLAVLLDTKKVVCPQAHKEIAAFLGHSERETRPSVLATVLSWVKALNTERVERSLARSTFDLNDLLEGKPITIYLCIPPEKLVSHKALLRLWVATLMTTILRREERPEKQTLFILDECAQLGNMPLLEQAVTLLRGYGLQVWTLWQDFEQVKANYPNGYMTLVNNSAVLQAFGVGSMLMAKQLSDVLDCPAHDLLAMKPHETVICSRGESALKCRRPDYLTDGLFAGQWDPNPFFGRKSRQRTERGGGAGSEGLQER